jgi:hypothetical protein
MRWKGRLAATTLAPLPCTQPPTSHIISYARFASTSSSASSSTPFPFPTHRNPSPHQIFHLPLNASQVEIKARCTRISILPASAATPHFEYRLRARADFPSRFPSFTGSPLERAPCPLSRRQQSLRYSPWEIPRTSRPRPQR